MLVQLVLQLIQEVMVPMEQTVLKEQMVQMVPMATQVLSLEDIGFQELRVELEQMVQVVREVLAVAAVVVNLVLFVMMDQETVVLEVEAVAKVELQELEGSVVDLPFVFFPLIMGPIQM